MIEVINQAIEWAALAIELLAVSVIVIGVLLVAVRKGTIRYVFRLNDQGALDRYKQQLGKPLLLGLELLVAADVIRTVAQEPTLANVAVLGLLVTRAHRVELVADRRDGRPVAVAGWQGHGRLVTSTVAAPA